MIEPAISYLLGNCSYSIETQYLAFDSEICLKMRLNDDDDDETGIPGHIRLENRCDKKKWRLSTNKLYIFSLI